jgi:pimeloyl-ACP methyl ester carboxylesterase
VRYRLLPVVLVGIVVSGSACSGDDLSIPPPITRAVEERPEPSPATSTEPAPSDSSDPPSSPPIEYSIDWEPLGDRTDGGWLTVPLDYDDPGGASIDLWVVRHRAKDDQRIGVMLANNGGPGAAASTVALNATSWFGDELTDRFDVVSWDPRGTGDGDHAVDCIDDDQFDEFYNLPDITADDDAEARALVELAQRFAEQCNDRVGAELFAHLGTNDSARDMDSIRRALGEDQVSYFGFSYGSELGGVWATMFPDTVRAAVFDGASDPGADALEHARQQWQGFEAALQTFLEQCSVNTTCAFHNDGDPAGALARLLVDLDADPAPTVEGRAPANVAVATRAIVRAMYNDTFWPALERSLADAANGDGAGLLKLNDAYYGVVGEGSSTALIEAFVVISCADDPERLSVEESDEFTRQINAVAPTIFPATAGSYGCTFLPDANDPRIDITGVGAGPILVIGTTGDPSTPLESSRRMAETLEEGVLLVVEANQHTGYRVNDCVDGVVHEYLVQLTVPVDGTQC